MKDLLTAISSAKVDDERAKFYAEKCDKDPYTCYQVRCNIPRQCAGKNRFDVFQHDRANTGGEE